MNDYADWYNKIYKNRPEYNGADKAKLNIIKNSVKNKDVKSLSILDVGCGRGHYLRLFREMGFKSILGIDPSRECATKYLKDVPHIVSDFSSFAKNIPTNQYDIVFCTDVLEHIKPEEVDDFIKELTRLAPYSILGIANHPDVQEGIELHLIQEPWDWWERKLLTKYSTVKFLNRLHGNKFFFAEAWT